jgi:DNA-binding IclR family transcriptional regulator
LPVSVARDYIDKSDLTKITPNTEIDPKVLLQRISDAKTAGYAWANEEYFRGDINIAAPLVDANGDVLGAINISLPTSRWTLETGQQQLAQLLIETARAISTSPPR